MEALESLETASVAVSTALRPPRVRLSFKIVKLQAAMEAPGTEVVLSLDMVNAYGSVDRHYALAAVNGQFFKHRLIVLGAVRVDDYTNKFEYNSFIRDYPADWNGNTIVFKPAAPPDYLTLSYIPKDATGKPTGPAPPAAQPSPA